MLKMYSQALIVAFLGLIFIPWLVTDPFWRYTILSSVGVLYVVYAITNKKRDGMLRAEKKAIIITGSIQFMQIRERLN